MVFHRKHPKPFRTIKVITDLYFIFFSAKSISEDIKKLNTLIFERYHNLKQPQQDLPQFRVQCQYMGHPLISCQPFIVPTFYPRLHPSSRVYPTYRYPRAYPLHLPHSHFLWGPQHPQV